MITKEFMRELEQLINRHSVDNYLGQPDFILATFVANVLIAQANAVADLECFEGRRGLDSFLSGIKTEDREFMDVFEFHTKFNQLRNAVPQRISARLARERRDFMQEELNEWWEKGVLQGDIDEIADGLIDLVYVAKGTAVMYGLPWRALWGDVQRANMAKVPGLTHRGTRHDVCKPEGWKEHHAPRTAEILAIAGYDKGLIPSNPDYPEYLPAADANGNMGEV